MSPLLERYAVLLAVALLSAAALTYVWPGSGSRARQRLGGALLIAVVIVLAATIAGRWARESQGPFLTMYDILLSNVFSLTLVFLVLVWRQPALRMTSPLVVTFLTGLAVWMAVVPAEAVPLPATFDNYWLWIHVGAGKLFLGLCMVCAAVAAMQLSARDGHRTLPASEYLWPMYFAAFVFHSVMLVAGAAWAHSAWGRFWSWDSLETSTLVTWLLIGGTLHARATFRRMPEYAGSVLVVVTFILAFLTFFGLPFLSIGPHKGFV